MTLMILHYVHEGYNQISYEWWNIGVVNKIIVLWFYSVHLFLFLFSFVFNSISIFDNFTEIHVTVSIGFDLQSLMVYSKKDENIGRSICKYTVLKNKRPIQYLSHKVA